MSATQSAESTTANDESQQLALYRGPLSLLIAQVALAKVPTVLAVLGRDPLARGLGTPSTLQGCCHMERAGDAALEGLLGTRLAFEEVAGLAHV